MNIEEIQALVKEKYEEAKKNGVVNLGSYNRKIRKLIHEEVEKYPNLVSFKIGTGNCRDIFIKFKDKKLETYQIYELQREATRLYDEGKFLECGSVLLNLITYMTLPKAYMYYMLADCALNLKDEEAAQSYSDIAMLMEEEEIRRARINKEYLLIAYEMGIELDEVIEALDMNKEAAALAKLGVVEELYTVEKYKSGDKIMKELEQQENKSKLVKRKINNVKNTRNFYKNRISE